jgi:hypothetical protein
MVGLITDNNETAYREEIENLAVWCQNNNLTLNVTKTEEMIVHYWKGRLSSPHSHQRDNSGSG